MNTFKKESTYVQGRLTKLYNLFERSTRTSLGFPCNFEFDYSALDPFLKFHINNAGDPSHDSRYNIHTHKMELEVIDFFKDLTKGDKNNTWGYITNGSTESNLYGLCLAKELYPNGIVYYSEDTHYSVPKIIRMLGLQGIVVQSDVGGRMDNTDIMNLLKVNRGTPPIIFANIGTTMKGAVDDIKQIKHYLKKYAYKDFYIHADAAMFGMILPFTEHNHEFTFMDGIDSIAISGQKIIGTPFPCGVVLTKKDHMTRFAKPIDYVRSLDSTISGSRNGLAVLFLWYVINKIGNQGFKKIVEENLNLTNYAVVNLGKMIKCQKESNISPIIWFKALPDEIMNKWQLAGSKEVSHIIINQHVTKKMIDEFIIDVEKTL